MVSVDTGPAHIAYALRIPTLTLFFKDILKNWGPLETDINQAVYYPDGITSEEAVKWMKILKAKTEPAAMYTKI